MKVKISVIGVPFIINKIIACTCYEAQTAFEERLKVLSNRKLKLVDEDLLEGIEIVLLVEDEHRLLVVISITKNIKSVQR